MARTPVFYSFHFDNDVMRVHQIRNIGAIEDNAPVSPSDWESVRRNGRASIQKWIEENMAHRRCVIVLVGEETAHRPWVQYEITKAWNDHRGLFGIHIHNVKCPRNGTGNKGVDPFSVIKLDNGQPMSNYITCYDPGVNAYRNIAAGLEGWVASAISEAKARWS